MACGAFWPSRPETGWRGMTSGRGRVRLEVCSPAGAGAACGCSMLMDDEINS
ncbi:MAG: hypothetical protein ACLTYN_08285 [Dysosmobacter welbionis]